MSGTFIINNLATWMPPNWCYNSILRAIAIRVQEIDPELADVIVNAQAETRSGYADLSGFGASRFAVLVAGTERTLDSLLSDPSQLEPSEFMRLVPRLSELLGMLRCDTRAAPLARPPGHLRVSPDHRWSAPWWAFDVVVEQMGADIWSDDPPLSELLFASRSGHSDGGNGLERLNSERFRTARLAAESMLLVNVHVRDSVDEVYYEAVTASYSDLFSQLLRDSRTWPHRWVEAEITLRTWLAIGSRASQLDIAAGGRYHVKGPHVLLWRNDTEVRQGQTAPFGCFFRGVPSTATGRIVRLEWNLDAGGSETDVRRAINELAGELVM